MQLTHKRIIYPHWNETIQLETKKYVNAKGGIIQDSSSQPVSASYNPFHHPCSLHIPPKIVIT